MPYITVFILRHHITQNYFPQLYFGKYFTKPTYPPINICHKPRFNRKHSFSPRHPRNRHHSHWCGRARHTAFKNCLQDYTAGASWTKDVPGPPFVWGNQSPSEHSGPRGESISQVSQSQVMPKDKHYRNRILFEEKHTKRIMLESQVYKGLAYTVGSKIIGTPDKD